MNWTVFTSLYNSFDTAFLAAVQGVVGQLVAYVQAPLLAGIALYVGGMLMVEMLEPAGNSGMNVIRLLLRGAIVYFAVSSVAVYNEYFATLFLQTPPNEIGNAIAGVAGGPALNPASFDNLWNTAWAAGEAVFKNLPSWSPKGIMLTFVVAAYWALALLAIGLAFLIYMGAHVMVGLLVATGPLFVCLLLWQKTAKMFDAWIGSMAAGVILQIFSIALLTVLVATAGQMVRQISAASGGAGTVVSHVMTQIQVLAEAGFLFLVCAYLAKEIAQHAGHIAGGVAHSVEPYTKLVYSAVSTVAKPAFSATGSAARAVTGVGRRVETSIYPAGRSLG
jgi:type IV secretion system protein VirB6